MIVSVPLTSVLGIFPRFALSAGRHLLVFVLLVGPTLLLAEEAEEDALATQLEAVSVQLRAAPNDCALVEQAAELCRRWWQRPSQVKDGHLGLLTYRAARKDTWSAIARRYGITTDLLRQLNPGIALHPGTRVRALDLRSVPLSLEVRRASFRLLIWRGPVLLGVFPVGLGTFDHPTPLGHTTVSLCARNPDWRDPVSRRIYKAGDRRNVLGGFWIAFAPGPDNRFRGIGVHGYTAESPDKWLEKAGSRGCVRLVQADISLVFSLMRPGVMVSVRD